MNKYRNAHLWLLIPFAIVIVGFVPSYWMRFAEAPWRQHLHGITATLWFVLLVAQPYLVTRGRVAQHRLFGMLSLILAGGVIVSALGAIPYNLVNERLPEVARYGLSFVDIILVPGFVLAVVMAMVNSKRVDDHAKWMISTVFWVVSPGLFRLLLMPMFAFQIPNVGDKIPYLLAASGAANIVVLAILMLRDRRAHLAYVVAAAGSMVMFAPMQVGAMQWWRAVADTLFTI